MPAKPATVWRRVMGSIYEGFLLIGPVLVFGFLYSVLTDFNDRATAEFLAVKRAGLQAVVLLLIVGYFTWGWSKGRCTLPMQTLGLRVQRPDGSALSAGRALARAVLAMPSMLTGIGIIWAIFDRDHQTLHDRLTDTRLVYIPVNRML